MSKALLFSGVALVVWLTPAASLCASEKIGTVFPGRGSKAAWTKAASVFNRGNHAASSGKFDSAIRLYEEAIRIYPDDAEFYRGLSLMLGKEKKDFRRAESVIKRAIELEPNNYGYRWDYAVILMSMNDWRRARLTLLKAKGLKKSPAETTQYTEILSKLDSLLKKASRNKSASQHWIAIGLRPESASA